MDQDQANRLEAKLDEFIAGQAAILDALPTIHALGAILVQRKTVNERTGLNRNTLSQNKNIEKFEEIGHRRTYIQIGEIPVVRQRKRK